MLSGDAAVVETALEALEVIRMITAETYAQDAPSGVRIPPACDEMGGVVRNDRQWPVGSGQLVGR